MAVGSNTLGLMFKIGVDTGDSAKQIQQMISQMSGPELKQASAQIAQSITQLNAALRQSKNLTDEQKATYQGLIQTLQQYKTHVDDTAKALERNTTRSLEHINQLRLGFEQVFRGDLLAGAISIAKGLSNIQKGAENAGGGISALLGKIVSWIARNPELAVAILAVVVATGGLVAVIYAAIKAMEGMIDVAGKLATSTKDDFDDLKKSFADVGTEITKADRLISQQLTKSFKDLGTVVDTFFLQILRESGKSLTILIRELIADLKLLAPVFKVIGQAFNLMFTDIAAGLITLRKLWDQGIGSLTVGNVIGTFVASLDEVRKKMAALSDEKITPFDPEKTKKAKEDMTAAQLEENRLARDLALNRAQAATDEAEINNQLAKGIITANEALQRRLGIVQTISIAEKLLYDARKVRIDDDAEREARRDKQKVKIVAEINELEDAQNQRDIQLEEKAEKQAQLHRQEDKDQTTYTENRLKQIDEIISRQEKLEDVLKRQKLATGQGATTGAPLAVESQIPGMPTEAQIKKGLDDAFAHYHSFFERLKEGAKDSAKNIRDELAQAIQDLPVNVVHAFTDAFQSLLDTFIKTGHTGPAVMKQFVSQVLQSIALLASQLAALAFGYALLLLAFQDYYHAAIAAAAGIALTALAIGLGFASRAAAPSQAGQAAGGGGFGGGDATPSQVNIGLGGANTLAISNAQFARAQIDAINNLNNKISSMSPGDVVTIAADQKPEAFATGTLEAGRRSGAFTREFMQISGARA
jgi:hypothetical protein